MYLWTGHDSPEVAGFAVSSHHSLDAIHASSLNISSINLCGSPMVCKCFLQLNFLVQAPVCLRAISSVCPLSAAVPGYFVSLHPPLSSPCIACYQECILI